MSRCYFIPEVIQTSADDGGSAALKALFGGYGIYLSYDRLRDICQPGTDGDTYLKMMRYNVDAMVGALS